MKKHFTQFAPVYTVGALSTLAAVLIAIMVTTTGANAANTHSISLASASSQYLSITNGSQSGLSVATSVTIEAWVNPATQVTGDTMAIAGKDIISDDQNDRGYSLLYADLGASLGFQFFVSSDGYIHSPVTYDQFNFAYTLPTNTWTHVAITWNGSTKTAKLYINGTQQGSNVVGSNVASIYNTTAPFRIGEWISGGGPKYWNGTIDDVRVWNIVRTSTDIADNYGKELIGTESGLVGWKLNNNFQDSTANGNHLTANNPPYFSAALPFDRRTISVR